MFKSWFKSSPTEFSDNFIFSNKNKMDLEIKEVRRLLTVNINWHIFLTVIGSLLTAFVTILGILDTDNKNKNNIKILIGSSGAFSVLFQTIGKTFNVEYKKDAYSKILSSGEALKYQAQVIELKKKSETIDDKQLNKEELELIEEINHFIKNKRTPEYSSSMSLKKEDN